MSGKRICIIGAGPSGMSALYHFANNENIPEIVCYEKQNTWGGQWNLTWRRGVDEHSEHCHSSMYYDLWTNAPKEANLEYPDYTFEKHFGQPIPSYPPIAVVKDYLEGTNVVLSNSQTVKTVVPSVFQCFDPEEGRNKHISSDFNIVVVTGRWTEGPKQELQQFIRFNTIVKFVRYRDEEDDFVVTVEDLDNGNTKYDEIFSHVIVCTGIYNFPNTPEFSGINKFGGRILHSHNFRRGKEFRGQRLLIIGNSFSGTDIAVQCLKFGAKHVIISYRSNATGIPWPDGIEERPLVKEFHEGKAFFIDGYSAEVDSVMFCTGYKNHFPFMESRLRIGEETSLYPPDLYKASLFTKGGNNKLFYIGVQSQAYTMTYFDIIALWINKYIMGQLPGEPASRADMEAYIDTWVSRLPSLKSLDGVIEYQAALLKDLIDVTGYSKDVLSAVPLFKEMFKQRQEGVATYRNHSFRSLYTGTLSPMQTPFMEAFDDSLDTFLKHN